MQKIIEELMRLWRWVQGHLSDEQFNNLSLLPFRVTKSLVVLKQKEKYIVRHQHRLYRSRAEVAQKNDSIQSAVLAEQGRLCESRDKSAVPVSSLSSWSSVATTTTLLLQQKWCKLYSLVSGSPESRVYPIFLRIKLYLEINYTIFY